MLLGERKRLATENAFKVCQKLKAVFNAVPLPKRNGRKKFHSKLQLERVFFFEVGGGGDGYSLR